MPGALVSLVAEPLEQPLSARAATAAPATALRTSRERVNMRPHIRIGARGIAPRGSAWLTGLWGTVRPLLEAGLGDALHDVFLGEDVEREDGQDAHDGARHDRAP